MRSKGGLQRTIAQRTKRATVEPKSAEVVERVRKEMRAEGLSERVIEMALERVEVLPEEDEELLH